ncbi:MAG: PD-(D/E)XK nuclease family protein, partial [Marmoricola sp.]
QLALYQYAVDSGAVDALAGRPLRSGGAELVQLGSLEDAPNAVVQPQAAPASDGPEREQLRAVLSTTATMLRTESFPAIAGQHCEGCSFVALCPIKSAGAVTR